MYRFFRALFKFTSLSRVTWNTTRKRLIYNVESDTYICVKKRNTNSNEGNFILATEKLNGENDCDAAFNIYYYFVYQIGKGKALILEHPKTKTCIIVSGDTLTLCEMDDPNSLKYLRRADSRFFYLEKSPSKNDRIKFRPIDGYDKQKYLTVSANGSVDLESASFKNDFIISKDAVKRRALFD